MEPGDRIETIRRIAVQLGTMDWPTANLYLDGFGIATLPYWDGNLAHYVLEMLKQADDEQLLHLERHLSGVRSSDGDPTFSPGFRLFVSHISSQETFASAISNVLARYGVRAFVAHEMIEPGAQWLAEIEQSLTSCNALVALLHEGFADSPWTGQEVGWVLGRGLPVAPVRLGEDPRGFAGQVQAVAGSATRTAQECAEAILTVLLKDDRSAAQLTNSMVAKVVRSTSWDLTNSILRLLERSGTQLSRDHVRHLPEAERTNVEVRDANAWTARREALIRTYELEDYGESDGG